ITGPQLPPATLDVLAAPHLRGGGWPASAMGSDHGRRHVGALRRTHDAAPRSLSLVPDVLVFGAEKPSPARQERRGGHPDPEPLPARRSSVAPPREAGGRQRPACRDEA